MKACFVESMRAPIVFFGIIIILMISLLPAFSQNTSSSEKRPETSDLHLLKNDELLKIAVSTLTQARDNYLAQLRGVAASEFYYEKARELAELSDVTEDYTIIATEAKGLAEYAKIKAERAKERVKAFKQRLEWIQAEKKHFEKFVDHIEKCVSAAVSLIETIDGLEKYLLEIRLRVDDGTLFNEEIPEILSEQKLNNMKHEIFFKRKDKLNLNIKNLCINSVIFLVRPIHLWLPRSSIGTGDCLYKSCITYVQVFKDSIEEIDFINRLIKEAEKNILDAEAESAFAERKYSEEIDLYTLIKEYSNQKPEELMTGLLEAEEEYVLLNGAFNLSHDSFSRERKKINEIQIQIESLKKPELKHLPHPGKTIPSGENRELIEKIGDIIQYHDNHLELLKNLSSNLEKLIKQGQAFQSDATTLSEHLFKMKVLINTLERMEKEGEINLSKISEEFRNDPVYSITDNVSLLVSEAVTDIQMSAEQLEKIPKQVINLEKSRDEMKARLHHLEKIQESEEQVRKWTLKLGDQTPEELVESFKTNSENVKKNK